MDLETIKRLDNWAETILNFSSDEDLVDAATYMFKVTECLKNYYYKEAKAKSKTQDKA